MGARTLSAQGLSTSNSVSPLKGPSTDQRERRVAESGQREPWRRGGAVEKQPRKTRMGAQKRHTTHVLKKNDSVHGRRTHDVREASYCSVCQPAPQFPDGFHSSRNQITPLVFID
jgi:hypothetical protein